MGDEPRRLDQKSGLLQPIQRLEGIAAAGKRRRVLGIELQVRQHARERAAQFVRSLAGGLGKTWLGWPQLIMVMPPLRVSIASPVTSVIRPFTEV